jgi:signal transduction histidine kinase
MPPQTVMTGNPVPVEAILCTKELERRPARAPNPEAVVSALVALAQTMANAPERILQHLVDAALELCCAHSAVISLLEEEDGRKIFRWHGTAGKYAPQHLWGMTPREFSPCGTVSDTCQVQLMTNLDRHFDYLAKVEPRIVEALLMPFRVDGQPVGTIWVIAHDQVRKFDAEDARILSTLGEFAAAAYKALSGNVALKNIVATIHEPLLVLDGTLNVRMASRSFYETFQLTKADIEGRDLGEIGNGEWNIPQLSAVLKDVLPKGHIVENFEVTADFAAMGHRVLSVSARKLWCEDNLTKLILLTIADITERKRSEEELLRSAEDSQRFASVAAHDLCAPLRSSTALLEILERNTREQLEAGNSHLLSMARQNLERLQSLVSAILTYSQVGGGLDWSFVKLDEPLQIALTNLRKEIEESRARIDCDPLPSVSTDRSLIVLIFQNLLSNALKYRREAAPYIRIQAKHEDDAWIISVTDNGQGFDQKFAKAIFEPFKRLHGSGTPGTGIGLATCARIVKRLGGRTWAESTKGHGATFYFSIPDLKV